MNNFAAKIFEYRSYTPIPFLLVMLIFQEATLISLIVGLAVALSGEAWRLWGVCYAGSETRTTGAVGGTYLVVSGAFAHVRNPLYIGNILMYVGIGIMSMALFPYLQIGAFLFFYVQYYYIINEEEGYLSKTFGEQYKKFRQNVPRLIPKISAYKDESVKQPPLNLVAGLRSEKRTLQAFVSITVALIVLFVIGQI